MPRQGRTRSSHFFCCTNDKRRLCPGLHRRAAVLLSHSNVLDKGFSRRQDGPCSDHLSPMQALYVALMHGNQATRTVVMDLHKLPRDDRVDEQEQLPGQKGLQCCVTAMEVLSQRRQSHDIDGVDVSLPMLCNQDNRAFGKCLQLERISGEQRLVKSKKSLHSLWFALKQRFVGSCVLARGHLGCPKTLCCVAYYRAHPCSGPSHHSLSALKTILKRKQRLQSIKLCAKQQRMPHFRYQSFTISTVSIRT